MLAASRSGQESKHWCFHTSFPATMPPSPMNNGRRAYVNNSTAKSSWDGTCWKSNRTSRGAPQNRFLGSKDLASAPGESKNTFSGKAKPFRTSDGRARNHWLLPEPLCMTLQAALQSPANPPFDDPKSVPRPAFHQIDHE